MATEWRSPAYQDCLSLAHELGEPRRDLVVAAEGNVSARLDGDFIAVSASGTSLATLPDTGLVRLGTSDLLALIDSADGDAAVTDGLRKARDPEDQPIPSVESMLHAVCYAETDAQFIAHTHPTAVNALLCSRDASVLVDRNLYPDQVVVMGGARLLLPYIDPGLELARAIRSGLREFRAQYGIAPRVIYAGNHGMFALAQSVAEALAISDMANKTARVLLAVIAAGEPLFMTDEDVRRIDSRDDEQVRRQLLRNAGSSRQASA